MRQALLLSLILLFAGRAVAQPVANFTGSPTTGCAPMVVSFANTSTGSPTGYSWTFGNGSTSTSANPIVAYTVPGTYTVTLTVSGPTGSNTLTRTGYIVVKQVPVVALSAAAPTTVCPYTPISFSSAVTWNATGSGTYIWDFGDGGSATSAGPTHIYTSAGIYTVKLTATNSANCPATDTQANLITVYAPPAANFVASDTAICALNGTTTFTSTTSGAGPLSYVWNFGDGSPLSTAGSPVTHAYSTAGSYTVKLIATDTHGCSDTETKANYIRVRVVNAGITAPAAICLGSSAGMAISVAATSGATFSWDFGDGSTPVNGSTTSHTYLTTGTYIITQTATIGGCTSTATSSIVVHPKPSSAFTSSPAVPCPALVQITFTSAAATGVSYSWNFGDGTTGSGATPSHWYVTDGAFAVTMTAVSSFGCSSTTVGGIYIPPMRAKIYYDKQNGCAPLTVHLMDSLETRDSNIGWIAYPYASVSSISWNFGDGSTGSSHSPTHTYNLPGSYMARLTLTTTNGCTVSDSLLIRVGTLPVPAFGASPRVVCVNDPVQFTDSSLSTGGVPIDQWFWDFGVGNSPVRNPLQIYGVPGTFNVTLHVGANGCWDSLTKLTYIVVNFPKSIIRTNVSCDTPQLVHFQDSSIGATSHIWYFGDGTTTTLANPSHQYTAPGFYFVSLVTFNSSTGCRDSATIRLNLYPIVFSFSALDTTICKNDTVRLNSVFTGNGYPTAYSWWIGSGSSTPYFTYLPSTPGFETPMPNGGQYHVAFRVLDQNGCPSTRIRNNYITVGAPVVRFRCIPPIGCFPLTTILFRDSTAYATGTTGAIRNWDFGDGSTAVTGSSTTSHPYGSSGSYGITLKVTDNIGCMDSLFIPNHVIISHPVAVFNTSGTNACVGVPFTFFSSATGNSLTYNWSFGDGSTSTIPSPTHAYASTGVYTVRQIVTDNVGCSDTMTRVNYITVSGRPLASFTMSDTLKVCPPLIVNFTNTSTNGAVTYNWAFGNSGVSTLQNPSNTYTTPQLYIVRLIAANAAGCRDTAYGRVRVLGYAGVMSYSPLKGCAPLQVNFQANNVDGVAGYIYDFGDGSTSATTATSISHVYTSPGPHVPKIILTDNLGCIATSMGLDTVKVDGVIAGFTFSPFPACDKGTIQFIDTSHGAYSALSAGSWSFHDGSSSNLASPSKTYPGPGSYAVTLYSSTVTGCKDTLRSKVIFYPLPVIRAGSDTTICLTDFATLRPWGGVSYLWSPAASLSCASCENPDASPSAQTDYIVIGTDINGCSNTDTVTVHIRTETIAEVNIRSTEICAGEVVPLHATGGSVYEWTPATGLSDPHIADPFAAPVTTQQYMLITKYAGCIPDTDYVDIIVHPVPEVEAGENQTMIAGNSVQLQAVGSSFINRWVWLPPDGLSCTDCPAPEARPKRSTTYIITALTEFDCTATDTLRVTVLCDNSQVYLPNTFTPDGNGVNDIFYPRGRGLETISHFRIYDRWGELVFERTNMAVDNREAGWDGKKSGRLLSPDIYVYMVEAICDNGEPIKWQGDVLLLR